MGDVVVAVVCVWRGDSIQRRLLAGDDFHEGPRSVQQAATQRGEGNVAPAGDDMIGKLHDALRFALRFDFVTHFRTAQHYRDIRTECLQLRHHLGRFLDIPDVHAKADDPRSLAQQRFHDIRSASRQREFENARPFAQLSEIGVEIAQAERSVGIAGVEGGEEDIGHG